MGAIDLKVASKEDNDILIINVIGNIDKVGDRKLIVSELDKSYNYKKIFFDLSDVEFADTVLVDILINFFNKNKKNTKEFFILNPSSAVHDFLTITGMDRIFNIIFGVAKK